MLHNKPMAIRRKPKYQSTFKDFLLSIFVAGMFGYCMYLVSQLPVPL